jgi:hypothetical protein
MARRTIPENVFRKSPKTSDSLEQRETRCEVVRIHPCEAYINLAAIVH